jgi:hypothetical protein
VSARFLKTTTAVSDDTGNRLFVVGYLQLMIVSDTGMNQRPKDDLRHLLIVALNRSFEDHIT